MEKPYQIADGIYEVPSKKHFFYQDPGWNPQEQLKGRNLKMSDM
jgi:hypothetical protein